MDSVCVCVGVFCRCDVYIGKCGIRETDSTVATAIRTIVVLIFAWLMVFIVGSQSAIAAIDGKTLLFLILSGLVPSSPERLLC